MVRGKKRKGFPIGKAAWFLTLIFLAFVSTLSYQEFFKPAVNNPQRLANGNLHRPGRRIVVCAGDSIVRGQLSFNYVNYLARRPNLQEYQFINAGINCDLAYNLLQRLEPVIACKPAYIVIQIGTEDLLGSLYPNFGACYQWTRHLPHKPERGWYRENLSLIVNILKQRTKAKIALVSLPMLGEAINSEANRQVVEYNGMIQSIASSEGVCFIPIYDDQLRYLSSSQRNSAPEFTGDCKQIGHALIEHLVLKKSLDEISLKNGYLLHTDGVHLNSRAGIIIANQVEKFLKNI
jgi:lysophospholipase L1-like esterase